MKAQIETTDDGAALSGAVTFSTVPDLFVQPLRLDGRQPVTVDLAAVTHIDSAGLALLVHWAAHAKTLGGSLQFVNLPPQLKAMARLCDLETAFGLEEAATTTG
ncbi:MAG: STAS domain-containing protein [Pseudomonadota bacterium]|nr:STAS domain-containing protein [Pseudomonadota bacterium]